ncbi:2OG-Fe(II) oxygenase [Microbacterium sp. 4R-513]|uniref:prolyl hydroxylase family protein n=1 Tax=Microbacterium sp. 4R-513 TaxID=2567934 RepID=UPI0013E0FC7F|nr:2OG-Fe(II) oxygenase [Microbacterium sp. 4R-513]QIG39409.1 2OG-Fe(II) oxygenase [Microbacterium sp. 4R-513]
MSLVEDVADQGIGWDASFLTRKNAAEMVSDLRFVRWQSSRVVKQGHAGRTVADDPMRVSRSAGQVWFNKALSKRVAQIEERVCADFGVEPDHLESWQAVQYDPGGKFETHLDGGSFRDEPGGERVLTLLLFLEQPESGGETYFPELDLLIEPTAGKLVVWKNLLPDGELDRRFLHAATPVREGRKTILTTWSRERPVR